MIVTFISQCDKKAINRTRRVLDAFANRIGDNTWQTVITEDGLLAVKQLLRKTVTKNTAVACHRQRSRLRSELVWIVGNRNKFSKEGFVAVNRTSKALKIDDCDTNWQTAPLITTLSRIAALFHDFGKINPFFAKKLTNAKHNKKPIADPFRHEWISLRLFEAFVTFCGNEDNLWIEKLTILSPQNTDYFWLDNLVTDHPLDTSSSSPLKNLPEIAKIVAWLIVSHHRLPIPDRLLAKNKSSDDDKIQDKDYRASKFATVLNDLNFKWCYPRQYDVTDKNQEKDIKQCWQIKAKDIPFNSQTWCKEANKCAAKLKSLLAAQALPSLSDPYLSHISRLVLMLSDHYYSSCDPTPKWHDPTYSCYANTNKFGELKQPLDDHLIGVSDSVRQLMGALTRLDSLFSRLPPQKALEGKNNNPIYYWQDKSYQEACLIQKNYPHHGFFGVNLASTGRGKTLANTRIMYGLADAEKGARFNIALGLRTLTLQTGKALRQKLNLDASDLAIMVGGGAVKELFEQYSQTNSEQLFADTTLIDPTKNAELAEIIGSESLSGLFEADIDIDFDETELDFEGILPPNHLLSKWLKDNHQVKKLLMSPILCCTIDHLIPATESTRGGRQIAPMLRLMSSDLVFDEPDDFSPDDYYALTRLVYWAGLLGSRVLLSSATLMPAEINGLYLAYSSGRKFYNQHRTQANQPIIAAWFDENEKSICHQVIPCDNSVNDSQANPVFEKAHQQFTKKRVAYLHEQAKTNQRRALEWVGLPRQILPTEKWKTIFSQSILETSLKAHQLNAITDPKTTKQYSVGLVRFANIDPMAAIAQQLLKQKITADTRIHLCVYHSRFPLLIRANIEKYLDEILNRNQGQQPHDHPLIQGWLQKFPEQQQIILIFASPVCEVGRDHDYDWMIIEPSSMRSIIQASGRTRRHRIEPYHQPNLFIMESNIRHYKHPQKACFSRPGFEAEGFKFKENRHFLRGKDNIDNGLMRKAHFERLDSLARLEQPTASHLKKYYEKFGYPNLSDLEHDRMHHILLGRGICPDMRATDASPIKFSAYSFWHTPIHYTGILQTLSRFRASQGESLTALRAEDEEQPLKLYQYNQSTGNWLLVDSLVKKIELAENSQINCWPNQKPNAALMKYLDTISSERIWLDNCARYLSVNLPKLAEQKKWLYHDFLGFIRE